MTRSRTRWLAAVTAAAVVALSTLGGAGAALALPGPTLAVTPSTATPTMFDTVSFDATLTGLDSSCVEGPIEGTWDSWYYNSGSWEGGLHDSGSLSSIASGSDSYEWGALGNGYKLRFQVTVTMSCLESPLVQVAEVETPWLQYYAYGYAMRGLPGASTWSDVERVEGVAVALLDASLGPDSEPVTTATTAAEKGGYTVFAPLANEADIAKTYKIRFTYPTGEVVYYDDAGTPWNSSTSDWNEATAGGPSSWVNTAYSPYLAAAAEPDPEPEPEPSGVLTGTVYEQIVPFGTGDADYAPLEGATVMLVNLDNGLTVREDTTDAAGAYELSIEGIGDTQYALVARDLGLENSDPLADEWYYLAGRSTAQPSADDRDDAAILDLEGLATGGSFDFWLGHLEQPTDETLLCDWYGENEIDLDHAATYWEEVCLTDSTVDDAETPAGDHDDAFDTFGFVMFPGYLFDAEDEDFWETEDGYIVASEDYTRSTDENGTHLSLTATSVRVPDGSGDTVLVDVVVDRVVAGSWMRWDVNVYLTGTHTPAAVPFVFWGNLGSDSDTTWSSGEGVAVSHDGDEAEDPIIGHALLSAGTWRYGDGSDDVFVDATGWVSYLVAVMDYCGEQPIDAALATIAGYATGFGSDIHLGGECPVDPTWSFGPLEMQVGVPFDETFSASTGAGWDWEYGGDIDVYHLPDGLEGEVLDRWQSDTAPRVRIHGTPTTEGEFDFQVELQDDWEWTGFDVEVSIAAAGSGDSDPDSEDPGSEDPEFDDERDLGLELDLEIGGQVSGSQATATATGLQDGADYDLVVRSTPQTLGVGTVPTGGTVTRTVTLPDLAAGWHSLTFTSTWNGGGDAVARVWFLVGADGRLLQVSSTAPALASTGADPSGNLVLATAMVLLGAGLVVARRRGQRA